MLCHTVCDRVIYEQLSLESTRQAMFWAQLEYDILVQQGEGPMDSLSQEARYLGQVWQLISPIMKEARSICQQKYGDTPRPQSYLAAMEA